MHYQELSLPKYVYDFLKRMNMLYTFRDKKILFLYIDTNLDTAKFFLKFNAKSVYFVNQSFLLQKLKDSDITILNIEELYKIPDKSVDLVIGLEILEHISDFKEFNTQIMRITKPDAKIELQGYPMWTSPEGHHIWLPNYKFTDESNPFEPWEHLIYENKEEMLNGLTEKGLTKSDSMEISKWIYNALEINRIAPNVIINSFIQDARETEYKRDTSDKMPVLKRRFIKNKTEYTILQYLYKTPKNKFFEIAREKYEASELLTSFLTIKINKKVSETSNKNIYAEDFVKAYVKEMNDKYGFRKKSVLNITSYKNFEVSQLIASYGAEHVNSVDFHYFSDEETDCEHYNHLHEKYDIVFGAITLPYIKNLKELVKKLLDFVKDDGFIYLQGTYLWPTAFGHNFPTHLNINFIGSENNKSPVLPWEHLAYETKEEMFNVLVKRGYSETDAKKISDYIFDDPNLNRLSYYDYINELKEIPDITFGCTKLLDYTKENEFYGIASKKYTSEELRTSNLHIVIRKKKEED